MDPLRYCDFSTMNDVEVFDTFLEFCGFENHKQLASRIISRSLTLQLLFQNTEYLREKGYVDDRTYLFLRMLQTLFDRINTYEANPKQFMFRD